MGGSIQKLASIFDENAREAPWKPVTGERGGWLRAKAGRRSAAGMRDAQRHDDASSVGTLADGLAVQPAQHAARLSVLGLRLRQGRDEPPRCIMAEHKARRKFSCAT